MKLRPTEPDLATLYSRISRGDLDLQPGFQRQEVWTDLKKRRLIDTILRGWHIPPIHVVEVGEGKQEVLDGQQRLVAIRDFMAGSLKIDGMIDPPDPGIKSLHNTRYSDLPEGVRRRFDSYAIRVIIMSDYGPEEPGELFFRLNQQTTLTAPEQRNAFFGPARDQVRSVVQGCEKEGLGKATIGFSNSRMAYDDIVARVCETIEAGTLQKKITATAVTSRYRSKSPYSVDTIQRVREALLALIEMLSKAKDGFALNKATAYSWLCFLATLRSVAVTPIKPMLGRFIAIFELSRAALRLAQGEVPDLLSWTGLQPHLATVAFRLYNDRASSRVADVTSVLVRDYVTWLVFTTYAEHSQLQVFVPASRNVVLGQWADLLGRAKSQGDASESLGKVLENKGWGSTL